MIDSNVEDIGTFMDEVLGDVLFENTVYYLTDAASKEDLFETITGKPNKYIKAFMAFVHKHPKVQNMKNGFKILCFFRI